MISEESLALIAAKHGMVKEAVQGRATELASIAFHGSEVMLGAWGAGWANGRWARKGQDHLALGGAPMDLAVGALGILASAFDTFGPSNSHVAHLSFGVGASYFTRLGMHAGDAARARTHAATAPRMRPATPLPASTMVDMSRTSSMRAPVKRDAFAWAKRR